MGKVRKVGCRVNAAVQIDLLYEPKPKGFIN